ncbi:HDIG domain-containing protein [Leptospira meyeri]|uniref:HD family phosphohydrolase n=1 Tax=Leptospira meyeri TaxID=29508 RepID=UPI0010830253|nr:HDIG domain-containing metalloprotein [Leptospira meyeri]TGM62041.1 HDIG domain-containing protein [Leptospira meyeri]TGM71654.1 HDIG domain-containing protein [Leptospira meyeri]
MKAILDSSMTRLTDFLTRVRPVSVVRNIQIILVFLTLLFVTYVLSIPFFGQTSVNTDPDGMFSEGKISPETIQSVKEFSYEDTEKTNQEKQKAAANVPYAFDKDFGILVTGIDTNLSEDVELLRTILAEGKVTPGLVKDRIPRWRNRTNEEIQAILDYPRKDKLKSFLQQYTNLIFSKYCIVKEDLPFSKDLDKAGAKIRNIGTQDQTSIIDGNLVIPRSQIYKEGPVASVLSKLASEKLPNVSDSLLKAVSRIGLYYVYSYPACNYNPEETENARMRATNAIPIQKSRIQANEVIVRSGDVITPEVKIKLDMMNRYATRANLASIVSIFLTQCVLIVIVGFYLIRYRPNRLNDLSSNLIIFFTLWIVIASIYLLSKVFYATDSDLSGVYYFGMFVPVGMLCLLLGFVYDEQLSIAIGFFLAFAVFFASRYNPTSFMLAFTVAVMSSIYGRRLLKRIDFLKAGFLLTFVQILVTTAGYLFDGREFYVTTGAGFFRDLTNSNLFRITVMCFVNGFASATAVQFLLPMYEYIFNIPTRFKLIELADTGHPLLQQLLTKAPSTYTHTFMVAALSERAAQNLNLDRLLVRVGVYFHDIGKIPNAGFFVENQHLIPKPEHIDKNNPALAAKTVIDHVLDGIEMAKKARLPREIISFIPEHHGTSTMAFFYHKALQEISPSARKNINKKDFQYPGPKPQSKETAIVMIADSLEAASRSLDEVSPESLDELIRKIVNSKLAENQLDESGLTIGDLEMIKSSFKEVLLSSLHQRPKYPKPEDTKALESAGSKKNKK